MTSLEPAVVALLALMFLGEVLSLTQCLTIALIMATSMGCAVTAQARHGESLPLATGSAALNKSIA